MKKFREKQKEKIMNAKSDLDTIEEFSSIGKLPADIKEKEMIAEQILDDPYTSTKEDVKYIADIAVQIKETELNPTDPVVDIWAQQELGIDGKELKKIFESNDSPEELKKDILEKMEAPKELIEAVDKENVFNKK